jgi:hypothetical protein
LARNRHRRERLAQELKRKRGDRATFDRILIVCEGKKTEPNYFEDIRQELRLPKTEVRVLHSDAGTEPRQIVDYAEAVFLEDPSFDIVYAVFDRDEHKTYHVALNRAGQLDLGLKNDFKKKIRFHAVPTVPCFELWILLHFVDVKAFGDRHEVIARVGEHIKGYTKGLKGVFGLTAEKLDVASARAEKLREAFKAEAGTDPFTTVDELVAKLLSYKR